MIEFKRTKKHAKEIHGGLSSPSKMPGLAFGIPANRCKVGELTNEVGSVGLAERAGIRKSKTCLIQSTENILKPYR